MGGLRAKLPRLLSFKRTSLTQKRTVHVRCGNSR